jgi:transcription-repair coupling factor (superfamily II helicase)
MENKLSKQVQQYIKTGNAFKEINSGKTDVQLSGLDGYVLASFIRGIHRARKGKVWAILPTKDSCINLLKDLGRSVNKDGTLNNEDGDVEIPILYLPSNDKKIYSQFEPGVIEYNQLQVLRCINEFRDAIIVTHLRAFSNKVVSTKSIDKSSLTLKVGDKFDSTVIAETLVAAGYIRTTSIQLPGEFTVRGEVVEIFAFSKKDPIRIFADWEDIDKIATFDPLTQETLKTLNKISISMLEKEDDIEFTDISSYIKDHDYFALLGDIRLDTSYKSLMTEAKSLYRAAYHKDSNAPLPEEILFDFPKFKAETKNKFTLVDIPDNSSIDRYETDGPRSFFGDFVRFKGELDSRFAMGWKIFIFTSNDVQKKRLQTMLKGYDQLKYLDWEISGGFSIPSMRIMGICEYEIFGRRKQIIKTLQHTKSSPLDSFVDLKEGDFVVHVNYGIGKFLKIDRVKSFDRERDYIKIAYSNGDNIYVPIEQANLVQRYIGSKGNAPALDRIGSKVWENKKAKARKSAEDLASYLITLYAKRKAAVGFPFEKDNDMQLQFEAMFPYQETPDQLNCIDDIKIDMESNSVMDRLVCGDVGFGKTEIAFRAAFKTVMSGKQVAFLAPTTILAEQHYNNFLERVQDFPINVALLSRVIQKKKQKETLLRLAEGGVDVLFGTHRILQKDILYKDLGLLVIDEEQRFGVKDKEKIKTMRSSIDSLALSATPIPRTLYMSLLKIRDMSLLKTPPIARKSIDTHIEGFNLEIITRAIREEIDRGGQVFYLHNRIESLDQVVNMLQEELPEVIIEFAHGQLDPKNLEDKMRRFVHQGIQVLVSTTIIENGIDIPNVNTIIIDRADQYGISQLYQLRGRVGRSEREAHAYLLYPEYKALSEIAVKRLKTISENTGLGAGFKVALKDMEIRGAGNLLGKQQSGQLSTVGLDMYIRLLDEEINKLRTTSQDELDSEVFLELDYTGFIPDSFIKDTSIKFEIYKKIAAITTDVELQGLSSEIADRFGNPPQEVLNLLYIAELKIICRKLKIVHLAERKGRVVIKLREMKLLKPDKFIRLLSYSNGAVTYDTKRPLTIKLKTDAVSLKDKSLFILETLKQLV